MADDELTGYIKKQKDRGSSLKQIKAVLLKAGYKNENIKEALDKAEAIKATGGSNIKKILAISALAIAILAIVIILMALGQNFKKGFEKSPSANIANENDFLDCIKKLENVANVWNDEGFKEIYIDPDDSDKINDFKEGAFGILRAVCEGDISFRIINVTVVTKDEFNAKINMYCNGAVDFKKLGKNYENAVRKEAKPDNLIDHADVFLVKNGDECLLKKFNY